MQNPIVVSSWSLHHHLGYTYANGPADAAPVIKSDTWGVGTFDILQLPAELAKRGYFRCELCHFHIPSLEHSSLDALAQAFVDAGVTIQTLLIDDGDLTQPATRERDLEWMARWIKAAALLGAENVRLIGGKAKPTADTLALAVSGLRDMVAVGSEVGIQVATENWHDLLSTPDAVHHVLDHIPGLGFMADTGNWSGPTKYDDLVSIFSRANLCHAKAHFDVGLKLDGLDFARCLDAAQRGYYNGPFTLIFMDDGDEWSGLDAERKFIEKYAGCEKKQI